MDWFTSDLHIDHMGLLKHRSCFSSMDEMDETLFKMFDPVRKGDRVFLLGDICWKHDNLIKLFDLLMIKKKAIVYWIEGNHDRDLFKTHSFLNTVRSLSEAGVRAIISGKGIVPFLRCPTMCSFMP